MSRMRGLLFGLMGLALVGFGVGSVVYHRFNERQAPLKSILPEDVTSDVSLNQIQHVTTQDGVKELVLKAASAEYQQAENKTILNDISATFFLKNGGSLHLVSQHGKFMTDTQDLEVSGDVVIQSDAYELNTERLFYDHKNRSIFTDSPVLVKGEGMDLAGESMVFSLDTERALVRGGVKAVFRNWNLF